MRVLLQPLDLIKTARRLAGQSSACRPRQSDLKRAVSTAYYAMFHALCRNCADCLIGSTGADRSPEAWTQAYRAVELWLAKGQCRNKTVIKKFPKDIEDFANLFVELQIDRHAADYDPTSKFSSVDVTASIEAAEAAIKAFKKAKMKDRRAFAAWTVLKARAS